MGKVKGGVPDRWYNYKSLGSVIEGSRIVAFKVPLQHAQIDKETEEDYRLNIDKLVKKLPKLGAVVDLTNTQRYYNPSELQKHGVIHEKIFVPGHVIPTIDLRMRFRDFVNSFLETNKNNDKIIGVHCTHGVNRTGFMICDYLVHDLKMHPLEAIQRFEAARNHKIERQNYRDFLIDGKNATIENNCETGHQVFDNMKPRSERNHYNRFNSERSDFQRRDYREGRDNQRSYRDNKNYDFEAYRHQRFNYNNDRSARRDYQGYSKGNSLEVRIPGSFRKEEKAQEYSSRRKRTSECMEDVEGMVKRKRSSEGYSRYENRYGQSSREYSPEGTMAPRIPGTPSPDRSSNSSTQWSRYSRNAPQDQRRGIHHCPRIPRERPREDRFKVNPSKNPFK